MNDDILPGLDTIGDPVTAKIVAFLTRIGLRVELRDLPPDTVFKGTQVQHGVVCIDESQLEHPGDVLHEAGHLAMLPPAKRKVAHLFMDDGGGIEMSATAWAYAASVHIGLPADAVFHETSYCGSGEVLLEAFSSGRYIGVPLLQWAEMTVDEKRAQELGVDPYPVMRRWLRERD
jgi:hypothetical protein